MAGPQVVSRTYLGLTLAGALLVALVSGGCGGEDDQDLNPDANTVIDRAAQAIGEITSVAFALENSGAAPKIGPGGALTLEKVNGRIMIPDQADAVLSVSVAGSLRTTLGAVAIGDDVWLSNPITGEMEALPPGFDIDPRVFFDPSGGWRPLLAGLTDREFLEVEDDLYHVRGTAEPDHLATVTAGLVQGQRVPVDLWIDPTNNLVTRVEFTVDLDGEPSQWSLELSDYDQPFTIEPPEAGGG